MVEHQNHHSVISNECLVQENSFVVATAALSSEADTCFASVFFSFLFIYSSSPDSVAHNTRI